mmetsp:Transcript_7983/g.14863  ORF Transcript_7983/g.14863 Transcript_7983/m.14863 type:complete len:305 (+) Transcript_7983:60-974(+)
MAPGAHATRLPSLLVGDVVIRHPDFAGLDSAAELFATDLPEAHPETPRWGTFWAAALRDAPPLPGVVRALLPEEGGFVLRPLLDSPQLDSSCRRLLAPCREVHAELGFPEPALISNDVFVEVRYAMAASTLGWFDFEDIREGTLRLFAIPGFEGDVRIITVVDEAAAATILSAQAALSTAPQVPGAPKTVQNKRLHQFLHCVATSPAAARWPTTAMIKDGAGILVLFTICFFAFFVLFVDALSDWEEYLEVPQLQLRLRGCRLQPESRSSTRLCFPNRRPLACFRTRQPPSPGCSEWRAQARTL